MEPNCYETLDGQVALVTGANRGIGREIARRLVAADARVFGGVRDPDANLPDGVDPVTLDVTDETQARAAIDEVTDSADRLDVLVNNAGVGGTGAGLKDANTAELTDVLDVNLRGPMVLSKYALQHLLESEAGRIVTVSSGVGILTDPIESEMPAYRISKAGANALTVSLDRTYGEAGLIANSVDPGWVATDMGGPEAPRAPEKGAETPAWLATFGPGSPSGLFWKDKTVIEF
ncbi:MAG: SDR family NAD(P)-dependent oxidoreductase [Halorhabdus sp.]